MGALLDKPITEKETEDHCGEDGLRFGASAMQGWRVEMEDSHTIIVSIKGLPGHSFVAVYDGHGGSMCANYAGKEMMRFIQATPDYKAYLAQPLNAKDVDLLRFAMRKAYLDIDEALKQVPESKSLSERSGCTALSAFITPTSIVLAHAGDSRAIVCSGGEVAAATEDHKPYDGPEKARIEAAGGHVSMRRVDGDLAVSRALGDFQYKDDKLPPQNCKVTCVPDTMAYKRTPRDELLLLCCDGVWDVMSNENCRECAMEIFSEGETRLGLVCEELIDTCLSQGSRDNMSVVMVAFAGLQIGIGKGVLGRRMLRQEDEDHRNNHKNNPDFDPGTVSNSDLTQK
jgi:serine/threonine protein phosphatase PrpC